MKQTVKRFSTVLLALLLTLTMIVSAAVAFAQSGVFAEKAYTDLVTFSDCQSFGPGAFNNFGKVLRVMHDDGLPQPDALLVGGDYSRLLNDYATPGIIQLRDQYTAVYENGDPDAIITAQGNHDSRIPAFYPTGMYDMGTYCFYLINEDDYPWLQLLRTQGKKTVQKTAQNIKTALDAMIENGDTRPVIFITHVPLHHTTRTLGGDNMYAKYLFDVINEAAKQLDIIFLFAHNHSGDYDDYIGGSVNFMAPGDTVRIPDPDHRSADTYLEETLNFTYTNCGYIGYSKNNNTETSTNALTLGAIRFFADRFVFLKYTEDGLFRQDTVERKHPATDEQMQQAATISNMKRNNEQVWNLEKKIFEPIVRFFLKLLAMLGIK